MWSGVDCNVYVVQLSLDSLKKGTNKEDIYSISVFYKILISPL